MKSNRSIVCMQVNTQLYSQREKDELSHLIRIMIAYNMSYRQERSQEGQYNYTLDPWVPLMNLHGETT